MRFTRVAPASGVVGLASSEGDDEKPIIYEFVQCTTLHAIDITRSVKSELLGTSIVARWNKTVHRMRFILRVSYNLVLVVVPIVLLVPTNIGRWASTVILPLGLPTCIVVLMSMRYDMLYILLRTYDFWFYWTVALITCMSLGLYLGDARAVSAFFIALGMLMCILVDASMTASRAFIVASVIACTTSIMAVTSVQLQLIPDVVKATLTFNGRVLGLPDIIANGIATLLVVLARNVYRQREASLHRAIYPSSIRCISFSCSLKLRCISSLAVDNITQERPLRTSTVPHMLPAVVGERMLSVPHTLSRQLTRQSLNASEMKFVPIKEQFDGRRTLLAYEQTVKPWSRTTRVALAVLTMSTVCLTVALYFYEILLDHHSPPSFCVMSFVGSCLVSVIVVPMLQPKMLRRLWFSFDFVFVSFQLTFLHVCLCDTLQWGHRVLFNAAGYILLHLVLVLDALMPITRQRIGYHKIFAMIVAFGFFASTIGYLTRLVVDKDWDIYDRVLFEKDFYGHRLSVRVVPLICSRLPMLMTWSLRLLWHLYKSEDGELILIRGAVAYDVHYHKPPRR